MRGFCCLPFSHWFGWSRQAEMLTETKTLARTVAKATTTGNTFRPSHIVSGESPFEKTEASSRRLLVVRKHQNTAHSQSITTLDHAHDSAPGPSITKSSSRYSDMYRLTVGQVDFTLGRQREKESTPRQQENQSSSECDSQSSQSTVRVSQLVSKINRRHLLTEARKGLQQSGRCRADGRSFNAGKPADTTKRMPVSHAREAFLQNANAAKLVNRKRPMQILERKHELQPLLLFLENLDINEKFPIQSTLAGEAARAARFDAYRADFKIFLRSVLARTSGDSSGSSSAAALTDIRDGSIAYLSHVHKLTSTAPDFPLLDRFSARVIPLCEALYIKNSSQFGQRQTKHSPDRLEVAIDEFIQAVSEIAFPIEETSPRLMRAKFNSADPHWNDQSSVTSGVENFANSQVANVSSQSSSLIEFDATKLSDDEEDDAACVVSDSEEAAPKLAAESLKVTRHHEFKMPASSRFYKTIHNAFVFKETHGIGLTNHAESIRR